MPNPRADALLNNKICNFICISQAFFDQFRNKSKKENQRIKKELKYPKKKNRERKNRLRRGHGREGRGA